MNGRLVQKEVIQSDNVRRGTLSTSTQRGVTRTMNLNSVREVRVAVSTGLALQSSVSYYAYFTSLVRTSGSSASMLTLADALIDPARPSFCAKRAASDTALRGCLGYTGRRMAFHGPPLH